MADRYRRKSNVGDWASLFDTLHQTYADIKKLDVTRQLEELKYNAQIKENELQRTHEKNLQEDRLKHSTSLENQKSKNEREEWVHQQIMTTKNAGYTKYKPDNSVDIDATFKAMQNAAQLRAKGATFSNMSFFKAQDYYGMATTDVTPNAITAEDLTLQDNYMSDIYFHPVGDYQYTHDADKAEYLRKIGLLGDNEYYSGADGGTPGAVKTGDDGVSRAVVSKSDMLGRWREYKIGLQSNVRFMDAQKYQTLVKGGISIDTTLGSALFQTEYMKDQAKIVEAVPSTIMTSTGYFEQTIDKGKASWDTTEAGNDWLEKNRKAIEKSAKKGGDYKGDILYQLYHGGNLNHIFDRYIAGTKTAGKGNQATMDDIFKDEWLINPNDNLLESNRAVYDALQGAFFARQAILGESQRQQDYINNLVDEKYRQEAVDVKVAGRKAAGAKWKKARMMIKNQFKSLEQEFGKDWQSSADARSRYQEFAKELLATADIDPDNLKGILQAEKERYNK